MRVIAAIIGGVLGAIAGLVIALLIAIGIARNELFVASFIAVSYASVGLLVGAAVGLAAGLFLLPHLRERETAGRMRSKRLLVLLGAVTSGTTILIGLLIWIVRSDINPPPDQKLLANFKRHEAIFDKLIEMLSVDKGLTRVDVDWTDPKDPQTIDISPDRISSYRRMLKDACVARGFESRGNLEGVEFLYWGIGSAISSDTTKGYAYMPIPPINLVNSLDGYRPDPQNAVRVYRHIRDNWYLFYEYIPG